MGVSGGGGRPASAAGDGRGQGEVQAEGTDGGVGQRAVAQPGAVPGEGARAGQGQGGAAVARPGPQPDAVAGRAPGRSSLRELRGRYRSKYGAQGDSKAAAAAGRWTGDQKRIAVGGIEGRGGASDLRQAPAAASSLQIIHKLGVPQDEDARRGLPAGVQRPAGHGGAGRGDRGGGADQPGQRLRGSAADAGAGRAAARAPARGGPGGV